MTMMTMVVVPTLVESGGGGLSGCDGDGGDAAIALLLPRLWLASAQRPLIFFKCHDGQTIPVPSRFVI